MALGRWKQRAASLDSLVPEEDETHVAKKLRLELANKEKNVVPKNLTDRWKQDATSLDSLESTDVLLPEEDEIMLPKKHCLHATNKKSRIPLKNFSGVFDEDRPSSGDSGISSDNQSASHQRLRLVQLSPREATQTINDNRILSSEHLSSEMKADCNQKSEQEPMVAVDLSKSSHYDTNNQVASKKLSMKIESENDGMNKENDIEQAQSQRFQKASERTCGDQASREGMKKKCQKKQRKSVSAPVKEEVNMNSQNRENQDDIDSLRSRRIEANARERSRVHTIGAAFETLRQTVPSNCCQQKLSKLAVLRIAAAYIRSLGALAQGDPEEFSAGVNQVTQALLIDGTRNKTPRST